MRSLFYSAAVIILLTGAWSCKDVYTICNLSKEVNFIAGFYQRIGASDVAVTAPSLTVLKLNTPGFIYQNQPNSPVFALPLDPLTDSAKYVVQVSAALQSDTLTIVYTSVSTNLSPECGSIVYNNISALRSTFHTIDSVKITAAAINNTPVQNARIYF